MDALKKEETCTVNDIYSLPDGERAELIDGQIYYMAPPSTQHQRLLNYISTEINLFIRKSNGECEALPAPFAVFLSKDDADYVEPDISVICDKDKITDKGCYGAPDWIIEIVSPRSRQMDYFIKLFKYRNVGVREYWIVDPIKEHVIAYRFEKETIEEYSFGEEMTVGIYEGFSIKIAR